MEGRYKSGRFRKKQKTTPGGRTVMRHEERRPKQARCSETGQKLHGMKRLTKAEAKHAAKSEKRPQRPFGGVLSSAAMRRRIKEKHTRG